LDTIYLFPKINIQKSFKYEYGQTVRVIASAPSSLKPGTDVAVVGMTKLIQEREVLNVLYPAGTDIYLIEYADGKSLEVPEEYIEIAK
jgi:hypothetical protein